MGLRQSWFIYLYPFFASAQSLVVEVFTAERQISALYLSAVSNLIAGAMLFTIAILSKLDMENSSSNIPSIKTARTEIRAIFRSKYLYVCSACLAIGIWTWYDSVDQVGPSKEALISGPLEIFVIIILSRIVFGERLRRLQYLGISVVLLGFVVTVFSDRSLDERAAISFTSGDYEAVISAVSLGIGIVLVDKLTRSGHRLTMVSSSSIFLSGIVLAVLMMIGVWSATSFGVEWSYIMLFSFLVFIATLSFTVGIVRIGSSKTSAISSLWIVIIIVMQLAFLHLGFPLHLPDDLRLAAVGGALGILGVLMLLNFGRRDQSLD